MTTYYAFSDESNYNNGENKSLAIIMINKKIIDIVENMLKEILNEYGIKITSFKWNSMQNNNKINALKDFLNFLFIYLEKELVFITTLKWSIYDNRHNIIGRDDLTNLSYMYYKLYFDIVNRKTEDDDEVIIFPDHNEIIDWEELEEILLNSNVCNREEIKSMSYASKKVYLKPKTTKEKNLIQIADIFAGIARSSFEDYDQYSLWVDSAQTQLINTYNPSNRQKYRFEIYKLINDWAKKNKLRISLESKRGFCSHNPNSPLNFWIYTPQNEKDKAPVK